MTLDELKRVLIQHIEKRLLLLLPDGGTVPVSFHITEIGHVSRRFIDCGGRLHQVDTCQLQAWVGDDGDHRLAAGKLAAILDKAADTLLPADAGDLPVEIEYEDRVIFQYPIENYAMRNGAVVLRLSAKHTDCLAKDVCLAPAAAPGAAAASCCGGAGC